MPMSSVANPISVAPSDVLARLRSNVPRAVAPAFEQALLKTELWLSELSAELARKGEADKHSTDSAALRAGTSAAVSRCKDSLTRAVDEIALPPNPLGSLSGLSLIEDEQMEMQLAGERLIEKLLYFHRLGLDALDARLHAVFSTGPYGKRLPVSPQVIADAARSALGELTLTEEFKVLAMRHFEALVDPVLSDLLKDFNAHLAAGGILPNLVIQDPEETRRRETLRTTSSAAPPAEAKPAAAGDAAAGAGASGPGAPISRSSGAMDQALFNNLIELVRATQLARGPAYTGPQRAIERPEALAVLGMMQATDPTAMIQAFNTPGASIAETIKQQMTQNAQRMGMAGDDERVALPENEDTAVELAGQMFEVMLRDRPFGNVVAPLLARMVLPFVRAAVIEPQLFTQPEHPARQLLNTVSEACEENAGESPQEKELLATVDKTIEKLTTEFTDDNLDFFGQLEKQLAEKLAPHRKRAEIAEKRASESQRGQERLEIARKQADETVEKITAEREMPEPLESFLTEQWKHHLSITALRQGTDSEAWQAAQKAGKPWLDLLDMADLGEPLPMARLSSLKEITTAVLETSGIHGKDAEALFNNILVALNIWSRENVEGVSSAAKTIRDEFVPPKPVPMLKAAKEKAAAANSTDGVISEPAVSLPTTTLQGPPPTEEELAEVRALTVGTWLQLPKEPEGTQQLKVSWISGISGLIMLVNRKGARIMAVNPTELIALKRKNSMMVFQRAAPVDQAMEQLFEKLRTTTRPA
jgi:hypothetical protein